MKKLFNYKIAVAGILVLGFLLRLINLTGSFWLDEAAQALESARPLAQQLYIQGDFQPPLFHLIVHFWMLGGQSEWWLRLISLAAGIGSIWLLIKIGEVLFDRQTGLIAGLFLATSQFHAYYSQELRPYSLATLLALASIYLYFTTIKTKKSHWIWFTISGIAGLYTMYLFPLLLVCLLGFTLLWQQKVLKTLILSYVLMGIAFFPWLPSFLGQIGIGTNLAHQSAVWSRIVSPPLVKMLPLTVTKFLLGRIPVDLTLRDILVVGLLVTLCLLCLIKVKSNSSTKYILVWLCLPILLALLISIKIPILDPKRVLYCLPAVYLLIAAGRGKGIFEKLVIGLILLVNIASLYMYAVNPDAQREPWRMAVTQVEVNSSPNTLVVFAFPEPFAPWQWYQTQNLPTVSIGDLSKQQNDLMWLAVASTRVDKVVVFDYLMDMTDPQRIIIKTLTNSGLREIGFDQYPGIGKVRRFAVGGNGSR